jgi:hypothetical protein
MSAPGGSLTLDDHIVPCLRALCDNRFYGHVTLTFEHGAIKEMDVNQKMRLPDQLRAFIKSLLSGR